MLQSCLWDPHQACLERCKVLRRQMLRIDDRSGQRVSKGLTSSSVDYQKLMFARVHGDCPSKYFDKSILLRF